MANVAVATLLLSVLLPTVMGRSDCGPVPPEYRHGDKRDSYSAGEVYSSSCPGKPMHRFILVCTKEGNWLLRQACPGHQKPLSGSDEKYPLETGEKKYDHFHPPSDDKHQHTKDTPPHYHPPSPKPTAPKKVYCRAIPTYTPENRQYAVGEYFEAKCLSSNTKYKVTCHESGIWVRKTDSCQVKDTPPHYHPPSPKPTDPKKVYCPAIPTYTPENRQYAVGEYFEAKCPSSNTKYKVKCHESGIWVRKTDSCQVKVTNTVHRPPSQEPPYFQPRPGTPQQLPPFQPGVSGSQQFPPYQPGMTGSQQYPPFQPGMTETSTYPPFQPGVGGSQQYPAGTG